VNIAAHICELLYNHDCVIIPEFGGFVANRRPSQINKANNKLSPPSKSIGFNINLVRNDGLLAHHISEKNNIKYEESLIAVKKFSDDIKLQLNSTGQYRFENIGAIFKINNTLRFEQDSSINFLRASFGLETIRLQPIIREEKADSVSHESKKVAFEMEPPVLQERKPLKLKRYIPYSIAAIPFILYLLWIPFKTGVFKENVSFSYSDLNPFSDKICPAYSPRTFMLNVADNENSDETLPLLLSDTTRYFSLNITGEEARTFHIPTIVSFYPDSTTVALPHIKNISPVGHKQFFVIAGCFQYLNNAESLVGQLKKQGFVSASIVDTSKGLYRVSFGEFYSRNEADDVLAKVRASHNPSSWILTKNN
jgi:nucleoid DNA-binding protein